MRRWAVVIARVWTDGKCRHHVTWTVEAISRREARQAACAKYPKAKGYRVGQVSAVG